MRLSVKLALFTLAVSMVLVTGCSLQDKWNEDTYLSDLYVDNLDAQNIKLGNTPLLIPAYGEMYIQTPFNVELTLKDTYYICSHTTFSGEMNGFTNNGTGRVIYDDITPNRIALINVSITASSSPPDVPVELRFRIYKNGIADIPSTVKDLISTGDRIESIPLVSLITLANPGDYFDIYMAVDKANATITIDTLQIIITTVD